MELFLIRHAVAVPRSSEADDATRPLTRRGRKRWARAVLGLKRLGITFERLYHSPWLRAVETADLLMPLVDGESIVDLRLIQTPEPALIQELSGQRVVIVGHQPWLGELLTCLVAGSSVRGEQFVLGKGSVAWLQGELRSGGMSLKALLPAKVLRAIGG